MTQRWHGSCHCGFVRFEVRADIDHVRACDCSICHKRGGLIVRVPGDALILHRPLEDHSVYVWGSRTARDYFCPHCGILPFRRPSAPTRAERAAGVKDFDGWAVNARCLDDFDPSSVPTRAIPGRKIVFD